MHEFVYTTPDGRLIIYHSCSFGEVVNLDCYPVVDEIGQETTPVEAALLEPI